MKWFVDTYLKDKQGDVSVLDLGSHSVQGSYKELFADSRFHYTGLDMISGPNVDVVVETPYHWPTIQECSCDVIISGQMFEHNEFFWLTIAEMGRVLKPDGFICIIAPYTWPRHRSPVDCYRFDTDGMIAIAKYGNFIPLHASANMAPPGLLKEWCLRRAMGDAMLVAQKPKDWKGVVTSREYTFTPNDYDTLATGFVPLQPERFLEDLKKFLKERYPATVRWLQRR